MRFGGESGTVLVGANLCNADLSGCDLYWVDLDGADLTDADMSGIDMDESCIRTNPENFDEYRDEEIPRRPADLRNCSLRGANLAGAMLYCNFEGTIMPDGTEFRPNVPQ
jgi:uncharacterized protein YjbI with pentapeptide repeats